MDNNKYPNDIKIFDNSLKLISQIDFTKYSKAMQDLEKLELKYKQSNDSSSLAIYYLNTATIFYLSFDSDNSLKYIKNGFKYVDKSNYYILGKLNELKAVTYAIKDDVANFEKYSYISKEYLEKSNVKSDLSDTYYNLITIESKKKNWDKLIELVKINDSLIKQRSIKIDLMLAEAYIHKGKIELARSLIRNAKSTKEFKEKHHKFMVLYHSKLAMINEIDKDYQLALENSRIGQYYSDLILKEKTKIGNNLKMYQNDILRTKYELNKVRNENNFQQQIVKYQKLALVFSLILILLLTVLFLSQYRFSIHKTKLNNELNRKNEELLKVIQIKNKLLDSISHELRTPLNAIKGVLYLFKDNENEKNLSNIELLENATNQLITLVTNVIDYNVIDENVKISNDDIVDLPTLIDQIVTDYSKIRTNENKVSVTIEKEVSKFIITDKTRLEQILSCLIDNALKFTSKGLVKIDVSLFSEENNKQNLCFKIIDTGIGISKESLSDIFELFNQGSNEIYLKYGGSGLGLALVKKNIELLNGNFNIISEEGKGTTFEFNLEVGVQDTETFNENMSIESTLHKCNSEKVLVVEDNKINQILIQKILTSKGYEVHLAENGQIAVDTVEKNDYCLILMDIMMPIMDGFEASKLIKKIKPQIPIIALTAISEELNKNRFIEAEIEKILNKPIKVEQLDVVLNLYCA